MSDYEYSADDWLSDDPNPGDDNLIREGIYAAGDDGNPDDHPPTHEEDPSFYGDPNPGDDSLYPECEHTPPCTGDRENAPCYEAAEEFKLDQAEAAGIDRDAAREALHEYELPAPSFTIRDDDLYDALSEDDDGITVDDFDHWPNGREFPS